VYKLLIPFWIKQGEDWVVQEALKRYREHCEQAIARGEHWPRGRIIQAIRKTEEAIEDSNRELDGRDVDLYEVLLYLEPDGIMMLVEALTRFFVQCEQDRGNKEMPPLGSARNGGMILSVRDNLNRELRRVWRRLPAVKKVRGH
jgi:hypothetical protein